VVLLQKEEEYRNYTRSMETLGLYMPRKGASFFFVTKEGEDFATLLHEVTHQLNHKVTDVIGMPLCFEEGIAEYFSLGTLSSGGRKLTVGGGRGERFHQIRVAIRKGSGLIPFDQFLTKESSGKAALFYPQAYGLTHFLMEGHPEGKLILYDIYAAAKYNPVQEEASPAPAGDDDGDGDEGEDQDAGGSSRGRPAAKASTPEPRAQFPRTAVEALAGYGLTPAKLEEQFRAYFQSLR